MHLKQRFVRCDVLRVVLRFESRLKGVSEAQIFAEMKIANATLQAIRKKRKFKTKYAAQLAEKYGDEIYWNYAKKKN